MRLLISLLVAGSACSSAYLLSGPSPHGRLAARSVRAGVASLVAVEDPAAAETSGELPQADGAALAESEGAPLEPALTVLEETDLINTKWKLDFTPRPDGWLGDNKQEQEFVLLADGSVVWGGDAGGFGTGGRWQLREQTLEVIRTTPLGLVTGRDYYMSIVTDDLQFEICGITRSYNWLYPVMVVGDWTAKRVPGRFAMVSDDEDGDGGGGGGGGTPAKKESEGLIDSSGFSFPRPSDFGLGQ